MQRFKVIYKGDRMFLNAIDAGSAMEQARAKLIGKAAADKAEPDADLATIETFREHAAVSVSARY